MLLDVVEFFQGHFALFIQQGAWGFLIMFYTGILIIYRDYFAMRPSNTNTKGMVSR
jgi:hypothetical protein